MDDFLKSATPYIHNPDPTCGCSVADARKRRDELGRIILECNNFTARLKAESSRLRCTPHQYSLAWARVSQVIQQALAERNKLHEFFKSAQPTLEAIPTKDPRICVINASLAVIKERVNMNGAGMLVWLHDIVVAQQDKLVFTTEQSTMLAQVSEYCALIKERMAIEFPKKT